MTSDRGSLLALDSFSSEESLRVAAYTRASLLPAESARTEEAAEMFIKFIGGERWRVEVLDAAMGTVNRYTTAKAVVEIAEKIAEWVSPAPVIAREVPTDPDPAPEKPTTSLHKKGSTKKN